LIVSMIFGTYGALIAYTLKEGEFLFAILKDIFGGSPLFYSIIFFLFGSYLIFKDIKLIEKCEALLVCLLLTIVVVILLISINKIDYSNLQYIYPSRLFVPFGIIVFAFFSTGAIPEIGIELRKNRKMMKKAIIIGSIIPIIVYAIFTFIIVGITGTKTTDGSILGLGSTLGYSALILGTVFGILTIATSFIAVGLALKEMYNYDLKLSKTKSSILTCLIPIIFAVLLINLKVNNPFSTILNITGIFAGGITGIAVILMAWNAKKLGDRKPEYTIHKNKLIGILLIIMFLAAAAYKLLALTGKVIT